MEAEVKAEQAVELAKEMQSPCAIATGAAASSDRRAVRGANPPWSLERFALLVFGFGDPIVIFCCTPSTKTGDEARGRSGVLVGSGRVIRVAKSWRLDPIIAQCRILIGRVR